MNQKNKKSAFTLLEVLISIMLLSMVLMALYKSAEILRASNKNLFNYLDSSSNILKGAKTLYMDIAQSDGNITIIKKNKFHRIIMENTIHSLYGLPRAKVVWLVYKEKDTLLRMEGGEYNIPLKEEESVAVDKIAINMELFKIYKSKKKDKILVVMQQKAKDAQTFMVQNLPIITKKREHNATTSRPKVNIEVNEEGTVILK